jgi:uncharacterized protein YuzE
MTMTVAGRTATRGRMRYDAEHDVLHLIFRAGSEHDSLEVAPGVTLELDARRRVLGIEVLRASRVLGRSRPPNGHRNGRSRHG